jgi:predicted glycoside hydrolase/deacetylase ChbG (UPF0249 family)
MRSELTSLSFVLLVGAAVSGCATPLAIAPGPSADVGASLPGETWAEKLGFGAGARVLILHADDIGMCHEANAAAARYLERGHIHSAAAMVPCPWFDAFVEWAQEHPEADVGLHLTLTSEWADYRWGPVANPRDVPGLLDPEGYLWEDVPEVVTHATPAEVERELRAQVERALERGFRPGHLDTHMGTLYGSPAFTAAYLKVATEYGIPAMVIEFTPSVVERFQAQGYPIDEAMVAVTSGYAMPKLDDFHAVGSGDSYEAVKQGFLELLDQLGPGVTEVIFHPSDETEALRGITNSWQQRVWEAQLFSDPEVIEAIAAKGFQTTNWKDMLARFHERAER